MCMYICICVYTHICTYTYTHVYLEIYMCMIRMGAKKDNINDKHMY